VVGSGYIFTFDDDQAAAANAVMQAEEKSLGARVATRVEARGLT
jgi:hypothetical protein